MAGKHRDLPDVLHQHRADGLLPGRLGRLPGFGAKMFVDQHVHSARALSRGLGVRLLVGYERFGQIMVDVGSQQSPQLIYFGTELRVKDPSKWVIPIEILAGYFFALVALLFVGLGQEMGRRFAGIENRMLAYSVDILGSLTGIAVFGVMSFFRLPAYVWFAIAMALAVYFVPRRRVLHALGGLGAVALVAWADWPTDVRGVATEVIWSPYYQVRFKPRYLSIDVNNIGHQGMQRVDVFGAGYYSAALAEPRRGRQAVRGRADHRCRLGKRRRGRAGARCQARRRRRDRPGDQRAGAALSSQQAVQRPQGVAST